MEDILQVIAQNEKFIIIGHTGPDGDAIGSCFGLALTLEKLGKQVRVVLEAYPAKYYIIPGRRLLHVGAHSKLEYDVIFALDCADIQRLGNAKHLFDKATIDHTKTTVCIDHHETNVGYAKYNLIEPQTPSTSEMVFRIIDRLVALDMDIATAIYAGIVSDTGGFRYKGTTHTTMKIAARLMDTGIPFTDICNELMYKHRFSAGKALGRVLENSGQSANGRIVYSFITREMLAELIADTSDLDGVVEYLMGTRGADVAVFVYEKASPPLVKISMRSNGPNVGRVAQQMGGGGHCLAAGCTVEGSCEEILVQVITLLEEELQNYDTANQPQT